MGGRHYCSVFSVPPSSYKSRQLQSITIFPSYSVQTNRCAELYGDGLLSGRFRDYFPLGGDEDFEKWQKIRFFVEYDIQ